MDVLDGDGDGERAGRTRADQLSRGHRDEGTDPLPGRKHGVLERLREGTGPPRGGGKVVRERRLEPGAGGDREPLEGALVRRRGAATSRHRRGCLALSSRAAQRAPARVRAYAAYVARASGSDS